MGERGCSGWNERFKSVISLPKNTAHERLKKAVEERRLYKEFTEKAGDIAKVLVREMSTPPDRKAYRPVKRTDTENESNLIYTAITCAVAHMFLLRRVHRRRHMLQALT